MQRGEVFKRDSFGDRARGGTRYNFGGEATAAGGRRTMHKSQVHLTDGARKTQGKRKRGRKCTSEKEGGGFEGILLLDLERGRGKGGFSAREGEVSAEVHGRQARTLLFWKYFFSFFQQKYDSAIFWRRSGLSAVLTRAK